MIPLLAGWRSLPAGDRLTFVPPEGNGCGRIVYRERVRPLLTFEALLAEQLAGQPTLEDAARGAPELFTTEEGEQGVAVTITGAAGGHLVRHDLAFVIVEDFYAVVHGVCFRGEHFARFGHIVRDLARRESLGLGARRRRTLYTPPPGWQGLGRGLETCWFPVDYPRNRTTITVVPASPGALAAELILEERLRLDVASGFEPREVRALDAPAAAPGLGAESFSIVGRLGDAIFVRELAVLRDGTFTYPMILDSAAPIELRIQARKVFREVVRSVVPLAARRPEIPRAIVSQWVD